MIFSVTKPDMNDTETVAGCYVSEENAIPRWITVNVGQAVDMYPELTIDEAIKALAIEIFKLKRSVQPDVNAFTGYQ